MFSSNPRIRLIQRGRPLGRRAGGSGAPRRGAAAVEFALVSPVIFLLLFAGIEFGRVLMALHGLEAAVREGCREAVSWNATQRSVEQVVAERLSSFGISGYRLTTDPRAVTSADRWDPVTVRVGVTYDQVSWLPIPKYLQGIKLSGSCTLPQEREHDDS